jgi:hypothetical protein
VTTKTGFKPGDVVRYEAPRGWCREGTAITGDDGRLVDTYWLNDNHVLTDEEIATAELVFSLGDFDELDRWRSHESRAKWEQYSPADRETVTSQHGLQVRWFVRKGAQPDLATQIENARQAVADAYEKLRNAERDVDYARRKLARLEAAQ